MEKIWRYQPDGEFTSKNAGFSMWCFGSFEGKSYFLKQFLSPKYPFDDQVSSPEKLARRKKECEAFEQRRKKLYTALTELSDGNDVRICEFFRIGSRYYIATEKIETLPWTVETIALLDEQKKRRLCAIIAHAVAALHKGGLVHSDLKHDNILYTETKDGDVSAKIIDFDGGFFEDNPPSFEDGVTGDTNYFSPEVCAAAYGESLPLSCKLDVFALGVLFHQYFSGRMPGYDTAQAACVGDAVLRGLPLELSPGLPEDIAALVKRMLLLDQNERPTAEEIFLALRPVAASEEAADEPEPEEMEETVRCCPQCGAPVKSMYRLCDACRKKTENFGFYTPGDLS